MTEPTNDRSKQSQQRKRKSPTIVTVSTNTTAGTDTVDTTFGMTSHHPQSRRRLVVPSSVGEWEEQMMHQQSDHHHDAYRNEVGSDGVWRSMLFWDRIPRVFPSSQILASRHSTAITKNDKTKLPPILADFYKSIGHTVEGDKKSKDDGDVDDDDDDDKNKKKSARVESLTPINNDEASYSSSSPLVLATGTTGTITKSIDAIDDPSLGTLSRGQHQKYLKLTSQYQTDRRTEIQRQELRQLTTSVVQEQKSYRQALGQFFEKHIDRYLIGFQQQSDDASAFARLASFLSEKSNVPYQTNRASSKTTTTTALAGTCTRFGKCRQILSAQVPPPPRSMSKKTRPLLDVDSLQFETVHRSAEVAPICIADELPPIHTKIPYPVQECLPSITLLQHDETAQRLALQHKADILTSAETIETLLQLPGDYRTQWMMYAKCTTVQGKSSKDDNVPSSSSSSTKKSRRICILDLPIAQPYLSPRACLEAGFEEGIYQWLASASCTDKSSNTTTTKNTPGPVQYVYTLWTLPELHTTSFSSSSRRKVVLIRSTIRLCYQHIDHPVRIRARMDYFPERGREIPTSYDKALWILDQLLLAAPSSQHGKASSLSSSRSSVFAKMGRIDPRKCHVLEWEDTSIAHAFAEENDTTTSVETTAGRVDPMTHWYVLVQLLHSVPAVDSSTGGRTTDDSHFLLCLPGRGNQIPTPAVSVSVHARDNSTTTILDDDNDDPENAVQALAAAGKIDLISMVFPQANTVRMGTEALRCDCPRDWKWEYDDRVPYTFPLSEHPKKQSRQM